LIYLLVWWDLVLELDLLKSLVEVGQPVEGGGQEVQGLTNLVSEVIWAFTCHQRMRQWGRKSNPPDGI
jgi:hypothetical protein